MAKIRMRDTRGGVRTGCRIVLGLWVLLGAAGPAVLEANAQAGPPAVDSFNPTSGRPGDAITIMGANLADAVSVRFNGVKTGFEVVSDKQLIAVVPPDATTGPITVANPAGEGSSLLYFEVLPPLAPPVISNLEPSSGREGTSFRVLGDNFTGVTAVRLGDLSAAFIVVSDTELKVEVPKGAKSGFVVVSTPGGTAQSQMVFEVLAGPVGPRIVELIPAAGKPGDRINVVLENVRDLRAVVFGASGAAFERQDTNLVVATVPEQARTGPVLVFTSEGVIQSPVEFVVDRPLLPPTIGAFDPPQGPVGTAVSVVGENLGDVEQVLFSGTPAGFVIASEGRLVAKVPPGATSGPIRVQNKAGTADSATDFKVLEAPVLPSITSFKPDRGPVGSTVQVTGENLVGVTAVTLAGMAVPFVEVSPTSLRFTVPDTARSGMVAAETAHGPVSSQTDFIVERPVPAPFVDRFSEWRAKPGQWVKVRGAGLLDATRVLINGVASNFQVVGDGEIAVEIPEGATSGDLIVEVGRRPGDQSERVGGGPGHGSCAGGAAITAGESGQIPTWPIRLRVPNATAPSLRGGTCQPVGRRRRGDVDPGAVASAARERGCGLSGRFRRRQPGRELFSRRGRDRGL
ncbi:MAG: IPT/TIG domain-containing protein [Verrucomicrobia bacterium]|nr:IPT/TIG domain-containing protein [Verrucomicrobiota bacterium]